MSTYTDILSRPAPKSFIQKSFKEMTQNEFTALKKIAVFGIDNFKKEPGFTREEFLVEDLWIDRTTPQRKKIDENRFHYDYFLTNNEIKRQIELQLLEEKENRLESEIKLPEWQRNLTWEKLLQTKLFTNNHNN